MNSYTPGPWRTARWTCHAETSVLAGDNTLIADCAPMAYMVDAIQNARLIAAAPELLATLEQIARLSREADRARLDVASMLGDIARAAVVKVSRE